jgi:hypothetical protein
MSSAVEEYLKQYYINQSGLEEYKLNFLKNHYYPTINKILNCDFKDFQIGVTKNRNIIWFTSKKNPNFEIIFDHKNKNYYKVVNKNFKNPQLINFEDYINKENNNIEKENSNKKKNDYYIINCITQ